MTTPVGKRARPGAMPWLVAGAACGLISGACSATAGTTSSTAASVSATDDTGQRITLPRPVRRIVSMAPHATELLFAAGAGAQVVGVDQYSDVPASVSTLPRLGDNFRIDIERIIALRPDLIVLWKDGTPARQAAQLRRLGIPLFFSGASTVAGIADDIAALGRLAGTQATAAPAAALFRQRLATLSAAYAARSPVRVFYQVWDRPLYTLNGRQIVSDALRICGGVNVFAGLAATAPTVSTEAVLAQDPEAVVGTSERGAAGGIFFWRAYPVMRAVRDGHLIVVDGDLLNRAGPRMVEGVAQLCARLDAVRAKRDGTTVKPLRQPSASSLSSSASPFQSPTSPPTSTPLSAVQPLLASPSIPRTLPIRWTSA